MRLSDGSGRNPFRKDPPEGWNHFFLPLGRLKKPLGVSGREKTSRERFFLCLLPVSSRASVFLLVLLVLSRSGVLCKWWPIFFCFPLVGVCVKGGVVAWIWTSSSVAVVRECVGASAEKASKRHNSVAVFANRSWRSTVINERRFLSARCLLGAE